MKEAVASLFYRTNCHRQSRGTFISFGVFQWCSAMALQFLPARRFLAWWRDELVEFFQGDHTASNDRTTIEIRGETARLADGNGKLAARAAPTDQTLTEVLAGLPRRKAARDVVLQLPREAFFVRDVQLPHAARRDFARLLVVDLERATPFKASDVYCGHTLLSRTDAQRQSVRHGVIKRSVVAPHRASVEAAGFSFAGVTYPGSDAAFVASDATAGLDRSARTSAKSKTLLAMVIALVATASFISVIRQERALAQLSAQTAHAKADARVVRDRLAARETADGEIADFNALRRAHPSRAALVEELTRVLPDAAYLTELKIKGATVDIAGYADSASALLPLLEGSPYLVDARALAPVTFDQQKNRERFSIRVQVQDIAAQSEAGSPRDAETAAHDVPGPEVE